MDLGDPRESLVSLKDHATWEADNRVEERWQWGAQILDLCNLSPEDYKNSTAVTVKTIQDCGECGSGGGGGDVNDNKGTASIDENGLFTVSFEEPVATTLYAFVTFEDDLGNEYSFSVKVDKGSDSASFDVSDYTTVSPYKITGIELGFKEDGSDAGETIKDKKYEYSTTYEGGGNMNGKTFVLSILCTKTDDLTAKDYEDIIAAQGQGFDYIDSYTETDFGKLDTAQATFVVLCQEVEHWMTEAEEEEYFETHSYDFVFLTEKTISEIKEDFTTDTENWAKGTITLNGKTYEKWMRRNLSGAQCPYYISGDTPGSDYELTYTLKINK